MTNHPGIVPNKKSIVIAEDDIDDLELLEEVLGNIDASFTIVPFNSGQKVIQHLKDLPDHYLPCLIVLDYNIPELNGAQVLEVLNADSRYHPIPKVIWSTSSSPAYQTHCLQLGALDYIIKPSTISNFEMVVRHMLSFCKDG